MDSKYGPVAIFANISERIGENRIGKIKAVALATLILISLIPAGAIADVSENNGSSYDSNTSFTNGEDATENQTRSLNTGWTNYHVEANRKTGDYYTIGKDGNGDNLTGWHSNGTSKWTTGTAAGGTTDLEYIQFWDSMVMVSEYDTARIIDPTDGSTLASNGTNFYDVAFDEQNERVWVAGTDGVYEIDQNFNVLNKFDLGEVGSVAYDNETGDLYIGDFAGATVWRYDPNGTQIDSASMGATDSEFVEASAGNGDVYFSDHVNGNLYQANMSNLGSYSSTATQTQDMEYSDYTNHLYVGERDSNGDDIFAINDNFNTEWTLEGSLTRAYGVSMDYSRDNVSFIATDSDQWAQYETTSSANGIYTTEVTGNLSHPNGTAMSDATMRAYNSSTGDLEDKTTTDGNGDYSLWVLDGEYNIEAHKVNYTENTTSVNVSGSPVTAPDLEIEYLTVSGYVLDKNGDPISDANITVEDMNDPDLAVRDTTTTNANGRYTAQSGSGDFAITAERTGKETNETSASVSKTHITGRNITLGSTVVRGRVLVCSGLNPQCDDPTGAEDGTVVELYGINESEVTTSVNQTARERAEEIRDELNSVSMEQIGYDPDLDLASETGEFESVSEPYVVVNEPEQFGLEGYTDSPDLTPPKLTASTGDDLILTVWDPADSPELQDGTDRTYPGTVQDGTIIIEQLDYRGDVVSTREVDTELTRSSTLASDKQYARVTLPTGFYRVKAEGSAYEGYVISVGSPEENINMITDSLETEHNRLSEQAEPVREYQSNETVVQLTTTTYTKSNGNITLSGYYNFSAIPGDIRIVSVQAYSVGSQEYDLDAQNASIQDLREISELTTYNETFIVTPTPHDTRVPSYENIRAVEVGEAPYDNMSRFQNRTDFILDLLENDTYANAVRERLGMNNQTALLEELQSLREDNAELQQRYEELADGTESDDEEIQKLQQALNDVQGELQAEDPQNVDFENGTVSARVPFTDDSTTGSDLSDNMVVTAHYPEDGTSEVVASENVSVDSSLTGDDAVQVTDHPVPDGTNMVTFSVSVTGADSEGIGNEKVPITRPDFSGKTLQLKNVGLSTDRPGPNEQVRLSLEEADESARIQNVNGSVDGPNGAVNVTQLDNETVQLTTDGAGHHYVTLNVTDTAGNQWSELITVKAFSERVDAPASVRARDGFTGRFALAGAGLEGGSVRTNGGTLEMSAVAPTDNVPNKVHYHSSELSGTYTETEVRVMQNGPNGPESARQHVKVYVHVGEISEDSVIYRNGGEPLAVGEETQYGEVVCSDDSEGCTIRSYTDANGRAEFSVNENPNVVDAAIHYVKMEAPVDLTWMFVVPSPDIPDADGVLQTLTVFHFQFADAADTAPLDTPTAGYAAVHGGVHA